MQITMERLKEWMMVLAIFAVGYGMLVFSAILNG